MIFEQNKPYPGDLVEIISREINIGEKNRKVYVLDNVIEKKAHGKVFHAFKQLPYFFQIKDRKDTPQLHMVHFFKKNDYHQNEVVKAYCRIAREFLLQKGIKVKAPDYGYATLILYGDIQFVHEDGPIWTLFAFMNDRWECEWGGDITFYDGDRQTTGIAVPPKPGRLVLFDGRISHRGGVPSKLCLEPRIGLNIRFPEK